MSAYTDSFVAVPESGSDPWLMALRNDAFERFKALGYPTTRNEDWHFTSVTPIAERTFRALRTTDALRGGGAARHPAG